MKGRTDIRVFYKDLLVAEAIGFPEDNENDFLSPIAEYAWEVGADPNYLIVEQLGWYDGQRNILPEYWRMSDRFNPDDVPGEWKKPMSDEEWTEFEDKFASAMKSGLDKAKIRPYATALGVSIMRTEGTKWMITDRYFCRKTFDHFPCKLEVRMALSVYDKILLDLCNPIK